MEGVEMIDLWKNEWLSRALAGGARKQLTPTVYRVLNHGFTTVVSTVIWGAMNPSVKWRLVIPPYFATRY